MSKESESNYLRKTSEVPSERFTYKGLMSRISKKKRAEFHNCLIIGLDFGTTFSGVSWVTISDFKNNHINVISEWPGTDDEMSKAPTALYYEFEDEKPLWGFEVPNEVEAARWFKLLLLRDEDMGDELRAADPMVRAKKMLRESGKTEVELIADYLRALWKHTLKTISKTRGKFLVNALQIHVVLTVPAIWKDYARKGMEEAAKKAGILDYRSAGPTSLTFAPEPEAAGLASLIDRGKEINPDSVYVICDAGGGTVDVITYKIGDLDPLSLQEAVEGTGNVCGGVFVDEDFEVLCKNRMGRKWSKFSQADVKLLLNKEWEYSIKPRYSESDPREEYLVTLPIRSLADSELNDTSRKPHIKNGRIHFSGSDIQKAFTTRVVPELVKLVDSQINKADKKGLDVTGIVLVGGFGSSPYLYEYLQARYNGIDILQSTAVRTSTAICRGAILKGLMDAPICAVLPNTPSITSTIARVSVGSCYDPLFKRGVHRKEDKFWDGMVGKWRARSQMHWYLKKGDDVAKTHPIRQGHSITFTDEDNFKTFDYEVIYQNESDVPPSRLTDKVARLCTINLDLSDINFNSLEDLEGANGRELKRLKYCVEMVPSGASTEFTVYHGDEIMGSGRANIEFQ